MVVCSPCRVRLPFRRELEQNRDLLNLDDWVGLLSPYSIRCPSPIQLSFAFCWMIKYNRHENTIHC